MGFWNSYRFTGATKKARRARRGAAVALIAAAGTLIAGLPTAHGTTTTTGSPGFVGLGGMIKFEAINGQPYVDLYATTTATTPTTSIHVLVDPKTCLITNMAQVSQLLNITVTGMKHNGPYFVSNNFGGLTTGSGCNAGGGNVDTTGTITVTPGSAISGSFLSAKVNINAHYSAKLAWAMTKANAAVSSGISPLNSPSSGGTDSGAADNTLVTLDPSTQAGYQPFDTLTLQPTTGVISLSDGGDSGDGRPSVFYLGQSQDYAVDCTSQNTVATNGTGSGAQSVTFQRLPNGYNPAKDPTCYKIGVTVNINVAGTTENGEPRDVVFVNNTTTSATGIPQQVHASLTIVWQVNRYDSSGNLRSTADIDAEMARQIQFVDGGPVTDVQWCGHLVQPPDPSYAAVPQHPANTPWCLTSDQSSMSGDTIVQTQVYHGVGDPKIW